MFPSERGRRIEKTRSSIRSSPIGDTVTWQRERQRGIKEVRHDNRRDSPRDPREGFEREREKKKQASTVFHAKFRSLHHHHHHHHHYHHHRRGEAQTGREGWLLCPPPFRPFHVGAGQGLAKDDGDWPSRQCFS